MIKKKKISKGLIVFLSFIIFFPIYLFIPSSLIVMGNEIESVEDGKGPRLFLNDVVNLQQIEDLSEYQISILAPEDGLSFNELIQVSGEVKEGVDITKKITLAIVQDDKVYALINDIPINEDRTWSYDLKITHPINGKFFRNGEYTLLAMYSDSTINFSNTVDFSVDFGSPVISMTSHQNGQVTNKTVIEGTVINPFEHIKTLEIFLVVNNVPVKQGNVTIDQNGKFTHKLNNLVEGENTYFVRYVDSPDISTGNITFNYDLTRPFVSTEFLYPSPNATKVPISNLVVTVKIFDNVKISKFNNPITLSEHRTGTTIPGTFKVQDNLITFTPDSGKLKPNTKYYVIVNPTLKDDAGNLIHTRNWTFTTATNTNVSDPHGDYKTNTNSCRICHSTHDAKQAKLLKGNLNAVDDPDGELENKVSPDLVNGYCMSCHDGTVASNASIHLNQKSNHNKMHLNRDGKVVSQSCGNCHNVHLDYDEHNPNLFKDHYVYDHVGVNGVGKEDSSKRLCETCHMDDLNVVLQEASYKVFSYKNWNTSLSDLDGKSNYGKAEDYSLCLRCHNSENSSATLVNIDRYYSDTGTVVSTNGNSYKSGHFISKEMVKDGSLLDGNIPCSDCHDTHSSSNIGLIKSNLGHNNTTQFRATTSWTDTTIRNFCLSCHNGKTELYGITISNQTNHMTYETSCVSCHGATLIEAAHAPSIE